MLHDKNSKVKNKIWIIGGSGFIGSVLTKRLETHGKKLITTSTLGGRDQLKLDLQNFNDFDYSIVNQGDLIIFLASVSSLQSCETEVEKVTNINVSGSAVAIERFLDRSATVYFASSDAVYGETKKPLNDGARVAPISKYGLMKAEIEKQFVGRDNFYSLRFSNVYGLGSPFFLKLKIAEKTQETFEVFDNYYRNFISIDDVVDFFNIIVKKPDICERKFINVGGPEVSSRSALVDKLKIHFCPSLNTKSIKMPLNVAAYTPEKTVIISSELRRILGRQPKNIGEWINENR